MNFREVLIEDDLVLADSGTKSFPLDTLSPITELIMKYELTNGGAHAIRVEPEYTITKIEIVDGGATYLSMSGPEAVAVATYEKGRWPNCWYNEAASQGQAIVIPLQFGRFLGDQQFALDPSRLRNPALRLTWAKNALHATGTLDLSITARVMEGIGSPSQVLLTKQVDVWTGGSSGVKTVDMLTDYTYRRLFIRSFLYSTLLDALITHMKLSMDADALVIFDLDDTEFKDIQRNTFPRYQVLKMDYHTTGSINYHNCLIDGNTLALTTAPGAGKIAFAWASGDGKYSTRMETDAGADVSGAQQTIVTGDFPHGTYCYPFGRPNDPESWLNVSRFGGISLKLTEGGLGANSVLVQQARSL